MNSRFIIMLLVALVLAGAAAFIAKRWADSLNVHTADTTPQNKTMVYVAAVNIPFAARIERSQYKLVPWPKENVPPDAFTLKDTKADPNALNGKIAQREFYAGEVLLKPQIKEHLAGSTLSALIPEGKRAMSVKVNVIAGVAGFILPGNTVDIIATRGHETYTLLKDMKVMAIDQTVAKQDKPAVVRALTLEVTPKQAEILVQAEQSGSFTFTLRNPIDSGFSKNEVSEASIGPIKKIKAPVHPEVEIKILPWKSQKFSKCTEDQGC